MRGFRSSKSLFSTSGRDYKKAFNKYGRLESLEQRHLLTGYMQMNLASDQAGTALLRDPALIAPWGVAEASNGNFWIANSGSSTASIYAGDNNGQPLSLVGPPVSVPGGLLTGIVANTAGFNVLGPDGSSGSSQFVFDSLNGNLAGLSSSVSSTLAQLAAQVEGAVYTGLAIGSTGGNTYLYAADFQNGTIDVFDTNFNLVTSLPGNFVDPNLPAGYSPFNVQVVNGQLFVTYAKYTVSAGGPAGDNDGDDTPPGPGPHDTAPAHGGGNGQGNGNGQDNNGPGDNGPPGPPGHGHHGPKGGPKQDNDDDDHLNGGGGPAGVRLLATTGGLVDVFNLDGTFAQRLSADASLNAPWGMALAPTSFGQFGGDLLVGNFGDGHVTAINPTTGAIAGQLTNAGGATISIPHLLGLEFGNGTTNTGTLYFTSAPSGVAGGGGMATTTGPSLIVLDSSGAGALTAVGNGNIDVAGAGTIAVDSGSPGAITVQGNAQIAGGTVDIVGSPGVSAVGNANVNGVIDSGVSAVADPFGSLPVPSTNGLQQFNAVHITDHSHVTLEPGVYNGGINVSGGATVLLLPGTYFLQGGGLQIGGNATVVGVGATIFNNPRNANDSIRVTGSGSLQLTGPASGTYKGIAIFQSPGAGSPIDVDGNGSITVNGVLYAPSATAEVSGNGRINVLTDVDDGILAQMIVFDLNVVGNATVNISGAAASNPIGGVHGLFGSLQAAGATPLVMTGGDFNATEGTTFSGAVAAFDAAAASAVGSNFTATINWGDGKSSTGTVTATGNGGFLVNGTHTYAAEGTETVTVTLSDNSGNTASTTAQVNVADAPLVAAGINIPIQSSLALSNLQIASVTDTGGGEAVSTYSATIDWGDGTSSSTGTVSVNGNTVNIAGSHTYSIAGRYVVNVTVQDTGGASTVVHSVIIVGSPPPDNLFVSSAFEDVLDRPINVSSLQFFTTQLQSGVPRGNIALNLTQSDEYLDGQIRQAYLQYLGRDADDAGLAYWLNLMKGGLTIEQLDADFIGAPEYYDHAGGTDDLWVQHMYFDLLGRAPDTQGVTFWLNALAGGEARSLVALGFADSGEHEGIIVRDDYLTFLGRAPAPPEVNYWVSEFEQGMNNEVVVAGFIASNEFFDVHSKP